MRRFVLSLYGLTVLLHVPFALAAAHALALVGAPSAPAIAVVLAITLTALLRGRMRLLMNDRHRPRWRMILEEIYFTHWCATVPAGVLFLVGLLIAWVDALTTGSGGSAGSSASVGEVALYAYAGGLALAIWSVVIRRRWVRIRTIDITVAGLGRAFDGYRIAQLSDLHIGGFCTRARGQRWTARANRLDVDLIALTGDYVTSGVAFHRDIAAVLCGLKARDGVIAVMGNHDYFGDGEPLVTLLREGGIEVLRNQHRSLERGGDRVTIAGVDDVWTRRASVARTLEGRDPTDPLLVLAHDPKLFPAFAERGAALVLSGHTHWGQVAVPFLATRYNFSRIGYRHHAGIYRDRGATLYVHPGLGTTGPPVRLGAPPEITVIRLRCAENAA